eukprot:CAMPEP_0183496084 /NCGR_PEP_ID=MMETSP0370-20130417/184772_1 /TAXON_ID=268820 /ORGANISM="Peridinium aciculiferum, Strain PAER-2" /LENGTH=126 /DNA_ID=CAMNT_0025689429 /DNA_START=472 /DNA_END=848 /DNA_ORIENTATION=+
MPAVLGAGAIRNIFIALGGMDEMSKAPSLPAHGLGSPPSCAGSYTVLKPRSSNSCANSVRRRSSSTPSSSPIGAGMTNSEGSQSSHWKARFVLEGLPGEDMDLLKGGPPTRGKPVFRALQVLAAVL